jgi:WD40 repeat protein
MDISWDEGLPSEKPCLVYGAQFQKTTGDLIVAGGSGANEVKVFDGGNSFKPCAQIKNLSRACFSVDFSNNGEMFACAGGDGVIRVFNVANEM